MCERINAMIQENTREFEHQFSIVFKLQAHTVDIVGGIPSIHRRALPIQLHRKGT